MMRCAVENRYESFGVPFGIARCGFFGYKRVHRRVSDGIGEVKPGTARPFGLSFLLAAYQEMR